MPLLMLLIGAGITLLLTVFSLLLGSILLVGGVLWVALRPSRRMLTSPAPSRTAATSHASQGQVLDGECVVLRQR